MGRLEEEIVRIWEDDLFGRRVEAEMLEAYLQSVSRRDAGREDQRAFTLAIDAGYGEGKSFFLRRLAAHLATNHPVAFVDAWADDIEDEPLTALAATLRSALDPLLSSSEPVREHWRSVLDKTGKIAAIAAKGALKRGLGLVFTSAAVEAADHLLSDLGDKAEAAVQDDLKTIGRDVVGATGKAVTGDATGGLMRTRIEAFEAGKGAIESLKRSLSALVSALEGEALSPPIIIVIDELDRCRPTYAIKLLEEIKHLFDVPGLVFVFGMHGNQLAHSVAGAYGPGFDGRAYLRRFISREYRLRTPRLGPLIEHLFGQFGIDDSRLRVEPVATSERAWGKLPASEMVARYMALYQLSPRDAYQVVDILQTCLALTKNPLLMAYLMPLIVGRVKGAAPGSFAEERGPDTFQYRLDSRGFDRIQTADPVTLAANLSFAASQSPQALVDLVNRGGNLAASLILDIRNERTHDDLLSDPARYGELLETVGRFTNPEVADEEGTED